jgi:acylphosphatase
MQTTERHQGTPTDEDDDDVVRDITHFVSHRSDQPATPDTSLETDNRTGSRPDAGPAPDAGAGATPGLEIDPHLGGEACEDTGADTCCEPAANTGSDTCADARHDPRPELCDDAAAAAHHVRHYEIEVGGSVHSVGYRPFVARLAASLGVTGRVWNTATTVRIEATGYGSVIDEFVRRLVDDAPELARIDTLEVHRAAPPARASMRFDIATPRPTATADATADGVQRLRL